MSDSTPATRFIPTPSEISSGKLSPTNLLKAINLIRTVGWCILEGIIPDQICDHLGKKLLEDYQELTKLPKDQIYTNFVQGHIQQDPPPFAPYVYKEIVLNSFVLQLVEKILGKGAILSFYSGNTNCPGSGTQPAHTDFAHLWEEYGDTAHPPAQLIVNIVMEDVTEQNGSTGAYPGSHSITKYVKGEQYKIDPKELEGKKLDRFNMKKGSVLIRDDRLWHRGMPNLSTKPRPMLALIYSIRWLKENRDLVFHENCEEIFENCGLDFF